MSLAEFIYCLVLLSAFAFIAVNGYYARRWGVPPVPTLPHVRRAMIGLLKKRLDPNVHYKIAELGSGWGGLAFSLKNNFPKSEIHGFEASPLPYYFSAARAAVCKRACFSRQDFFTLDLSGYDVIVCYLFPRGMEPLKKKLEEELKPGAYILSNAFALPGWEPIEQTTTSFVPVFLYKKL